MTEIAIPIKDVDWTTTDIIVICDECYRPVDNVRRVGLTDAGSTALEVRCHGKFQFCVPPIRSFVFRTNSKKTVLASTLGSNITDATRYIKQWGEFQRNSIALLACALRAQRASFADLSDRDVALLSAACFGVLEEHDNAEWIESAALRLMEIYKELTQ